MPAFLNFIRTVFHRPHPVTSPEHAPTPRLAPEGATPQLIALLADLESRSDRLARMARREVIGAGFSGKRFTGIAEQAQDVAALSAQARESLGVRPKVGAA